MVMMMLVCVCATGLTAAAMAELQKLQKMKMMMNLQNGNESDNDDLHSNTGITERHAQTHSTFRTVCTNISIQVIVEHHADGSGENKEPEKNGSIYFALQKPKDGKFKLNVFTLKCLKQCWEQNLK